MHGGRVAEHSTGRILPAHGKRTIKRTATDPVGQHGDTIVRPSSRPPTVAGPTGTAVAAGDVLSLFTIDSTGTLQIKGQPDESRVKTVVFSEISFRPETALQRRETRNAAKTTNFLTIRFTATRGRTGCLCASNWTGRRNTEYWIFAAARNRRNFRSPKLVGYRKKQKPRASIPSSQRL